ncbi:hypothetical protein [Heyndrickxia ginsengihumi]|uniref:Uncharacterized protein n=1 Tax=Heyndrickxia ginsengihumi TaxID=363870 RepID=A0A6M0P286_9BACI|nr:hypothetical protein [Heyndrickxia ginsengihumi]MCM3024567.1 hypothetical protein [Heyndrickxia ginsengihumi]NEY18776.1 hypothetical protein [Heyndrickxia ginsengihumi]
MYEQISKILTKTETAVDDFQEFEANEEDLFNLYQGFDDDIFTYDLWYFWMV